MLYRCKSSITEQILLLWIMATRVLAGELLGADKLERQLAAMTTQVQGEKENLKSSFQQLHSLLEMKEQSLLEEMDEIVVQAKQEFTEKIRILRELKTAREGLERYLTENKLSEVLEKNLHTLEEKIGEELTMGVTIGWVELSWKKEQLEQSVSDVCEIVTLKQRPLRSEDYSLKLRPVWSREAKGAGEVRDPAQLAIDNTTQNIFVIDRGANAIQVFNEEGKHLYRIPTAESPIGIALTEKYIFISAKDQLVKMRRSNNKSTKSVQTENNVWGIDIDANTNIYGCENKNRSVIVFDKYLKFLKRIMIDTSLIQSDTQTHCIKLYNDSMYVMFGVFPPFHLQIFSLEGELVRCLIQKDEIEWSYFFSIDRSGNIIVADWGRNEIKIFSREGEPMQTIDSDNLPGDMKFNYPFGVAINKNNMIIVAHRNKECCLIAF